MVIDDMTMEITDEMFSQISRELHNEPSKPEKKNRFKQDGIENISFHSPRRKADGTYDKKPLNDNYFKEYYHNNLKEPFQCPDCGRIISSTSNLSKHRNSNVCKRARNLN